MSRSKPSPVTTSTSSSSGTAASPSSTTFESSSLNDIDEDTAIYDDDDDDDDDESNVSDLDSILAMAKRLDDASIISDPSCIEGAMPQDNNRSAPGGVGIHGYSKKLNTAKTQYDRRNRASGGGGRGLYSDRRRDLDSIASESDESEGSDDNHSRDHHHRSSSSSSSSSSSNSSSSNSDDSRSGRSSNNSSNSSSSNSNSGSDGASNSHTSSGSDTSMDRKTLNKKHRRTTTRSTNRHNNHKIMGKPRLGFHGDDYNDDDDDHERQFQYHRRQRHYHREYRQQESPASGSNESEDDVLPLPKQPKRDSQRRGEGDGGRSTTTASSYYSRSPNHVHTNINSSQRDGGNKQENNKRQMQNRRKMVIMIPVTIVLVVVAIIAIVIPIKNRGKNEEQLFSNTMDENADEYQLSLPTSSPTYSGLYECPMGKSGTVPIRGCVGFVTCNSNGEAIEPIQFCGKGTLYDVYTSVCNHVDSVVCSTPSLSPAMASSLTPVDNLPSPAPVVTTITAESSTDESIPSTTTSSSSSATTTLKPMNLGEEIGPILSDDLRLDFSGVSSPGDVTVLQMSLQNYLNNFYSPNNLDTMLDEDDVLRSLSEVSITLTIKDFENRKRSRILVENETMENQKYSSWRRTENKNPTNPKIRGRWRKRNLQTTNDNTVIIDPRFIVVYDQTTIYRTTDASVSIESILSRPFDEKYSSNLVVQFQSRDPATFSDLTGIEYLESNTPNTVVTIAPTNIITRTKRPSFAPATIEMDVEVTSAPASQEESTSPTTQQVGEVVSSPVIIIQGITWLDINENGLYEADIDTLLEEVFVNLRECEGQQWINTTKSNSAGQYLFTNVEEGEYYLDFYKPSPSEMYEFTMPLVGFDNVDILDSDVVEKDEIQGQSKCMIVKEGFTQLTNAGYIELSSAISSTASGPPPSTATTTSSTPVTTGSTAPQFCAFVTSTGSGSGQEFDFEGCSLPCSNPERACPNGMLCAYTRDC